VIPMGRQTPVWRNVRKGRGGEDGDQPTGGYWIPIERMGWCAVEGEGAKGAAHRQTTGDGTRTHCRLGPIGWSKAEKDRVGLMKTHACTRVEQSTGVGGWGGGREEVWQGNERVGGAGAPVTLARTSPPSVGTHRGEGINAHRGGSAA